MKIFKALTEENIKAINEAIAETQWVDGKATALGAAKDKKSNFQITREDPIFNKKILPYIVKVHTSPVIRSYTFFHKLISPRLASYYDGGNYDWHVDVALMEHERTDLSFTMFLTDKSDYEGGEMRIQIGAGHVATFKGKKGEIFIYPSGLLHKVEPVTSGERRVIVGWVRSKVKMHEHRERLYTLNKELGKFRKELGNEKTEELNTLFHQMVRDYSE